MTEPDIIYTNKSNVADEGLVMTEPDIIHANESDEVDEDDEFLELAKFTCYTCPKVDTCKDAWDRYNVENECIAEK